MNRDEILREMGLTPIWRLRRPLGEAVPDSVSTMPLQAAPVSANALAEPVAITLAEAVASPLPAPDQQAPDAVSGAVTTQPDLTPEDAEPLFADEFPPEPAGETPEFAFVPRPDLPSADAARPAASAAAPAAIGVGPERQGQIAALDWTSLANASVECRACGLCRQRKQAVFGVGDTRPDWLFIGEGPGEQEDLRGEPFVGVAGQLLDAMLASIALKRGDKVYIANAVKCRPPGNRTPSPEEIATCRPFLMRQIALLRPKLIVLLGRAAVNSVLDVETSLVGLRGRVHQFGRTPVVVTYHPAYLLRSLPEKAKAWEDLCLARRVMRGTGIDTA